MGLGGGFPQPGVFSPASSGSPQPVGTSLGLPQAAVPLSTVGLVGEVLPQPDGPAHKRHQPGSRWNIAKGSRASCPFSLPHGTDWLWANFWAFNNCQSSRHNHNWHLRMTLQWRRHWHHPKCKGFMYLNNLVNVSHRKIHLLVWSHKLESDCQSYHNVS